MTVVYKKVALSLLGNCLKDSKIRKILSQRWLPFENFPIYLKNKIPVKSMENGIVTKKKSKKGFRGRLS